VNDLALVERVIGLLASRGVPAWVFGGWAEELLGLAPARSHGDVDLLVAADDWTAVDALLTELDEIEAKRFAHKRAFVIDGVMVELFLVRRDEDSLFTTFWGERRDWPVDTLDDDSALPVASAAAVAGYRTAHPRRPVTAD
jgi:hypothetical protein